MLGSIESSSEVSRALYICTKIKEDNLYVCMCALCFGQNKKESKKQKITIDERE